MPATPHLTARHRRTGLCVATTPLSLLEDLLDMSMISTCEEIFTFMERNVRTWTSVCCP